MPVWLEHSTERPTESPSYFSTLGKSTDVFWVLSSCLWNPINNVKKVKPASIRTFRAAFLSLCARVLSFPSWASDSEVHKVKAVFEGESTDELALGVLPVWENVSYSILGNSSVPRMSNLVDSL